MTTNDYTCEQSPDTIRHVQGQGWNDIGYQFLVDKCGTVFEGRAGGIDKPVFGAQTYGFNTDTTGVAVLGNYNDAISSQPVLDAVAAVAAWKLGLYGYDAAPAPSSSPRPPTTAPLLIRLGDQQDGGHVNVGTLSTAFVNSMFSPVLPARGSRSTAESGTPSANGSS